jgi:hypothetical protein
MQVYRPSGGVSVDTTTLIQVDPTSPIKPKLWFGPQVNYDAIPVKDDETLYTITDGNPMG